MFGTLGFEDLESTLPLLAEYGTKQFGTMHWKRSPSLAGFGDCQVASLFCPHCLEKPLSSAHFGLTTSCGNVATMILFAFMRKSCVKHVNSVCHAEIEVNDETRCFQLPKKGRRIPTVTTCQRGRANLKFRLLGTSDSVDMPLILSWKWAKWLLMKI